MGFFAGLDAEKYDRKYSDRELARRIAGYFRPQIKRLLLVAVLVLIVSGSSALLPIIVSRGVDYLREDLTPANALIIPGVVLLSGVVSWAANWQARRLIVRAVADVVARLANESFAAAAEHDLSFYDQFSSGRIASRITSDTQDFGQLVILTTDLISQVVEAIILAVVLVSLEWRLSLTLFSIVPLVVLLAVSFRSLARKVTRAGMRAMANVNQTIKETVSGIVVAKNFRQEARIFNLFDETNQLSYQVNVRRGLVLSMVFPALNTLGGWMTALFVYIGALSAVQGAVTVGAWYLFVLSLDRFMFPVMNLSSFWTQIQNGLSAAERVFALIDAEPSVVQTGHLRPPRLRGEIEFNRVQFRYKDNEAVLEDFTLRILPGESVALVGHTGAGKSSIVKLIARFYEFQGGQILVDGFDIRHFDLDAYRCRLGIVSQTPFLFSGTVMENICYSCGDASEDQIARVAHQIGGGDWLDALPEGLNTQVGERGAKLSMGQRQLVSLMRVLVQKPAIFVLDEATASVDPFTEWQIQQVLQMILAQSTSILIAHRLSTVKAARRIIVLDHGKIIEQGNHEMLMQAGGHYSMLYNTYFRHQSLSYINEVGKVVQANQYPDENRYNFTK
ncbi:MAG: ABC transporter ATP-binding protein [Chloroflexota bacterium]|jgi:ATP-binding cassette subfamily B protein